MSDMLMIVNNLSVSDVNQCSVGGKEKYVFFLIYERFYLKMTFVIAFFNKTVRLLRKNTYFCSYKRK